MPKNKFEKLTNQEITRKHSQVRVVGCEDETKNGIMDSRIAFRYAREAELDLVLINEVALPPICKIIDYVKYLYESKKAEKKSQSISSQVKTKQIQLGLDIFQNDIDYRVNNAIKYLEKKNKVKVTLMIKGSRNMKRSNDGEEVILNFLSQINAQGFEASFDTMPKLQGKNWSAIITAKK